MSSCYYKGSFLNTRLIKIFNSEGEEASTTVSDVCAACGDTNETLKRCTACRSVYYCDVNCQKGHRNEHKKTCKLIENSKNQRALPSPSNSIYHNGEELVHCVWTCNKLYPLHKGKAYHLPCCGQAVCLHCSFRVKQKGYEKAGECFFCGKPVFDAHGTLFAQLQQRIHKLHSHPELCPTTSNSTAKTLGAEAMQMQAEMCYRGMGVCKDYTKACELSERAMELGCLYSNYSAAMLGELYEKGLGVPQDVDKARRLYTEGAKGWSHCGTTLGNGWSSAAQNSLGRLKLLQGSFDEEAKRHFQIAAARGNKDALENLRNGHKMGVVTQEELDYSRFQGLGNTPEIEWKREDKAWREQYKESLVEEETMSGFFQLAQSLESQMDI